MIEPVRLSCHDEIVPVQPLDFMCPPGDGHSAPLSQDRGMMSFLLRQLPDPVGEGEGAGEIGGFKDALQSLDAIPLDNLPFWHLGLEFGDLFIGDGRLALPASDASHPFQGGHLAPPPCAGAPGGSGWPGAHVIAASVRGSGSTRDFNQHKEGKMVSEQACRRDLVAQYKQTQPEVGVYRIVNRRTNKALVGSTPNLASIRNTLSFAKSTNSPMRSIIGCGRTSASSVSTPSRWRC